MNQLFPERHLTPDQMSNLWQGILIGVLGYTNPSGVPLDTAGYNVRISWPTGGAPSWKIDEDVCFIQAVSADDEYDRLREDEVIDNVASITAIAINFAGANYHVNDVCNVPGGFKGQVQVLAVAPNGAVTALAIWNYGY